MGNQGNSFDWCRQIAEWIQSGVIGEVYEVHCWTDRPIWPQGLMRPSDNPGNARRLLIGICLLDRRKKTI